MEKVIKVNVYVTAEPTGGETDQELADRILDEVTEALSEAFVPAYVELDPAVATEKAENEPTLEEIVAAYQTTDFKPIRRIFTLLEKGVDHVCPLVALAVHRGVVDRADPAIEIDGGANAALDWAAGLWGDDFVIGLLDGWDGQDKSKADPEYIEGHGLGVEAAKVLSPSDPDV